MNYFMDYPIFIPTHGIIPNKFNYSTSLFNDRFKILFYILKSFNFSDLYFIHKSAVNLLQNSNNIDYYNIYDVMINKTEQHKLISQTFNNYNFSVLHYNNFFSIIDNLYFIFNSHPIYLQLNIYPYSLDNKNYVLNQLSTKINKNIVAPPLMIKFNDIEIPFIKFNNIYTSKVFDLLFVNGNYLNIKKTAIDNIKTKIAEKSEHVNEHNNLTIDKYKNIGDLIVDDYIGVILQLHGVENLFIKNLNYLIHLYNIKFYYPNINIYVHIYDTISVYHQSLLLNNIDIIYTNNKKIIQLLNNLHYINKPKIEFVEEKQKIKNNYTYPNNLFLINHVNKLKNNFDLENTANFIKIKFNILYFNKIIKPAVDNIINHTNNNDVFIENNYNINNNNICIYNGNKYIFPLYLFKFMELKNIDKITISVPVYLYSLFKTYLTDIIKYYSKTSIRIANHDNLLEIIDNHIENNYFIFIVENIFPTNLFKNLVEMIIDVYPSNNIVDVMNNYKTNKCLISISSCSK